MGSYVKSWRLALLLAIVFSFKAYASTPLVSVADFNSLEISNQVDVYLDARGEKSFDDVRSSGFAEFKRNEKLFPTFGTFPGTIWLRFSIHNNHADKRQLFILLNSPILETHLYASLADGSYTEYKAGRVFTGGSESFANRVPTFPITFSEQEAKTFYVSIRCDLVFPIKLSINTAEALFQSERISHSFAGFYFGIMLIMACYNLFLFFSTGDQSFFWYALTVLTLHMNTIGVYSSNNEYFGLKIATFPAYILPVSKFFGTGFLIQFSRVFLFTQKNRILDIFLKLNLYSIPFFLALLLFQPIATVNALQNLSLLSSIVALIIYSGQLFFRGLSYARFYFIAWFPVIIVGTIALVLNMSGNTNIAPNVGYFLSVAAITEVLLLSMALGDKVNQLRIEKEANEKAFRDEIMEMNRSLEQNVKEKTRDIRVMLDNLKLGIFTIDEALTLGDQFSNHLRVLINPRALETRSAMQCLFTDSDVGQDRRNQVEAAIYNSIGCDTLGYIGNEHLLIRHITQKNGMEKKELELDWSPICKDDGHVERILVAVKDVTAVNQLKRESQAQKLRIEFISSYLNSPRHIFKDLELELLKLNDEIKTFVARLDSTTEQEQLGIINALFRNYHTLKANTRRYQLRALSDAIHEIESYLQNLRAGKNCLDAQSLMTCSATILQVLKEYHSALHALGLDHGDSEGPQKPQHIESFVLEILSERRLLAQELKKPVPRVSLDIEPDLELTPKLKKFLETSLLHFVRNSLDHGFENEQDRRSQGKPRSGLITIRLSSSGDGFALEYSDDGRGLDLDAIQRIALKKGLLAGDHAVAPEDMARVIFLPGFSTKGSITDISGRGVGLDAVANSVQEMGGRADIILKERHSEGIPFGRYAFMFVLSWPYESQRTNAA